MGKEEKQWVDIKLKADAVQSTRLQGNHICLQISGGPSDAPAIISSELTDNKPQLILYVKKGKTQKSKPTEPADSAKLAKQKKIEQARTEYKAAEEKKLVKRYTTGLLTDKKMKLKAKTDKIKDKYVEK